MAKIFQDRVIESLGTSWTRLPSPYRTPLIITSCTALLLTPLLWKRLTYQPQLLPPAPSDYKYRFANANDSSSTFTLPDGRTIGYAQYGDLQGRPIITLHGVLGSRLESALLHDTAKELGARIIGIDRPGMGWSSPDPRPLKTRRVIDHSIDVEALAQHLQLEDYAVLGISGGGPYALACARALPSSSSMPRLKAVSVVTGLGLPDMSQPYPAILMFLMKYFGLRSIVKWMFTSSPAWDMKLSDSQRTEEMRRGLDVRKAHPADLEIAKLPNHPDMVQIFLLSSRQAASQGWDGFLDDTAILAKDPGFRVEHIPATLPVQLWYGLDDTNIAPKAGEETAERLRAQGNSKVELHMVAGETHGSTQVKYQGRYIQDLIRAMDT